MARKLKVGIIGTGGMSHQIHGTRFGMTNEGFDRRFLEQIVDDFDSLVALPPETIMKIAGTEAVELSMWYAMRACLSPAASLAYRFYTTPAVTGCGVVALDEA